MKKNDKLIAALNSLLVAKLTVINQFLVDSELCENSGHTKLHKVLQKLASDQMLLAEWLIERISFLNGSDTLAKLSTLMIGKTVSGMMSNSKKLNAFRTHNEAILLAQELNDEGTAELLTRIIKMEEVHINWTEIQREQIEQRGLENYLITQTESMAN